MAYQDHEYAIDERGIADLAAGLHTLTGLHRPKGATPFQTYLTVAYKQCVARTKQHGAPLAVLSCNPPQQASNFLTVRTLDVNGQQAKSVGSCRLDVKASPADVKITFGLKDVRNKLDLSDYTGELRVTENWRITDKNNGPTGRGGGSDPATNQDIAFVPLDVTCSGTPLGQHGRLDLQPANDSERAHPRLDPGGPAHERRTRPGAGPRRRADGVAATEGDNTLFMDQGIFVP